MGSIGGAMKAEELNEEAGTGLAPMLGFLGVMEGGERARSLIGVAGREFICMDKALAIYEREYKD